MDVIFEDEDVPGEDDDEHHLHDLEDMATSGRGGRGAGLGGEAKVAPMATTENTMSEARRSMPTEAVGGQTYGGQGLQVGNGPPAGPSASRTASGLLLW